MPWLFLLLSLVLLSSCARNPGVVRIYNGTALPGPKINSFAYAHYLDGALLEEQDQLEPAGRAYRNAIAYCPNCAEIWLRVFVISCKTGKPDWDAWDKAHDLQESNPEIATEKERCLKH